MSTCQDLQLDGLVIIGGTTSNTVATHPAKIIPETNYFTIVVSILFSINGALKDQFIEIDFGLDTVCRMNSHLIINICIDAHLIEKYHYFVYVMGHKTSHVVLEFALQPHPSMVILDEEVKMSIIAILDILN